MATNQYLYPKLTYDPVADFAPVTLLALVPNLLVARKDLPANSVAELIAYAKANPGKLSFGSSGVGTSVHLSGELFKKLAGVDMVHVPYRGTAQATQDLIGGRIDLIFDNITQALPHVRGGAIKALGITTAKPSPAAPEFLPIAQTLPGFDVSSWFALFAPAKTPAAIIAKVQADAKTALGRRHAEKPHGRTCGRTGRLNPGGAGRLPEIRDGEMGHVDPRPWPQDRVSGAGALTRGRQVPRRDQTNCAAARSSIAAPIDLNSVISLSCARPAAFAGHQRCKFTDDPILRDLAIAQRNGDVTAFGEAAGVSMKSRARVSTTASASRIAMLNAPTRSRWQPGFSQSPLINGVDDSVAQEMRSAARAAASSSVVASTGYPCSRKVAACALARAGLWFQIRISESCASAAWARTRNGQSAPAPTISIRAHPFRAR